MLLYSIFIQFNPWEEALKAISRECSFEISFIQFLQLTKHRIKRYFMHSVEIKSSIIEFILEKMSVEILELMQKHQIIDT